MSARIPNFLSRLIKKKQQKNTEKEEKELKKSFPSMKDTFFKINQGADKLLMLKEPKVFSLEEESNIVCKYKQNYILTKDGNLSMGVELSGISYSALQLEEELNYLETRINFFTKLHPQIEMNVVIKKEKVLEKSHKPLEQKNPYAREIIAKWQSHSNIYKIKYYLMISTTNKTLTGAMESFKSKTQNDNKEDKSEASLKNKLNILDETYNNIKSRLSLFHPRLMNADEVLNFYATYANAKETNLRYSHEMLTDSYISSNLEFQKSRFIFETNEGKTIFARFISIKAYEGDEIKSLISSNLLKNDNEFMVFIHLTPYSKEKAVKKIKDNSVFAENIIKEELATLMEEVKADRENLVQASFSVLLQDEDENELEEKTKALTAILENQNLNIVRESLNQKALFFSFSQAEVILMLGKKR
ncbi:VirB4 family type IV secretion/conjugal transfer ATPase [Campylobacter helveticus]|uniref:VirB4 family type IV secretion/conjugal transfer ATPase n=1 Tax=Campylobacter helveticus TaxID=28898 RepID=UPI001F0E3C96|nr:hypothetical protein [Campylobacter helveticus]